MESVQAQQIMLAAAAGAMVVLFGAVHALFLALAKLGSSRTYLWISYAAYGLFFGATLVLARTLHLSGFWAILVILMLIGYLFAPYAIWHLSVATHGHEHDLNAVAVKPVNEGELNDE